jgi:hypothetical protein
MLKNNLITFLFFSLLFFISKNVFANYDTVGSFKAKANSEALNKMVDREISIGVSLKEKKGKISISYEMPIGELDIIYPFQLDEDNKIKSQRSLDNLIKVIKKGIEWSNVAKENKVDVQKKIPSEKFCVSSSNNAIVDCTANFASVGNGVSTFLLIYLDEVGTKSKDYNQDMFAISYENQKKFLNFLENKIHKTINYLLEQETKSEGLFN